MIRRHKLTTALVAALIAALLLAGAAIAATNYSQLLEALFPGGASVQAQRLLVQDNLTDEIDGLRLTVKEHLYDGRSFHITWDVEATTDEAVYVATEYRLADAQGNPIEISQWSNRNSSMDTDAYGLMALNVPLGYKKTQSAYEGHTSNSFMAAEAPQEPWTYTLELHAYTTNLTPVALTRDYDDLSDDEILAMEEAGQIGIRRGDNLAYLYKYPAYQAVKQDIDWSWAGRTNERIAANEACGLLTPKGRLSVTLHMDPAKAAGHSQSKVLAQPTELTFKGFTLKIAEMGFDLTGAYATYAVPASIREDDYPKLSKLFLILDQDGRLLNDVLGNCSGSWTPPERPDGDVWFEQGGGVPQVVPNQVRLLWGPEEARALIAWSQWYEALEMYEADPAAWEEQVLTLK